MKLRHRIWRPALAAVASTAMLTGGALALGAATPAGAATDGIILTVNTLAPGSTGNTVTLPLNGVGLDATIDWGDGTSAVTDTTPGDISYTYALPGTYTITVTGIVPEFGTPSGSTPAADDALTAVTNWDGVGLTSLYNAFSGDSNLTSVPTDLPSTVTETGYMFEGATSFNQDLNTWDTTNVTDMSGMFEGATAFNNADATLVEAPGVGWDTTNVTDMVDMFEGDTAFNEDLGSWSISKVSDLADALDSTSMTTANFDATLTGWADEAVLPDLTLGAADLTFDVYGQAGYDTLISAPDSWTIIDAGEVSTATTTTATPLIITTEVGTVGTPLMLVTSGGSGTGDVAYTVYNGTAEGCVIDGDELTVTSAGTCIVTATDLTDGIMSAPTTITFAAASSTTTTTTTIPSPLTLGFAPKSKTAGSAERRAITNLIAKLETGATVTVTGYAQHNSTLARERANAIATLLRADGATVKVVVSGQVANKVVITTTAQ